MFCETCPCAHETGTTFIDGENGIVKTYECRHDAPRPDFRGNAPDKFEELGGADARFPIMTATQWCYEHPERKGAEK